MTESETIVWLLLKYGSLWDAYIKSQSQEEIIMLRKHLMMTDEELKNDNN